MKLVVIRYSTVLYWAGLDCRMSLHSSSPHKKIDTTLRLMSFAFFENCAYLILAKSRTSDSCAYGEVVAPVPEVSGKSPTQKRQTC